MAFNDPISELLTKLRNAQDAQHKYVDIHISKTKMSIIKILKDEGFVSNYLENDKLKQVRIFLKYNKNRLGIMRKLRRISSPGLRKYTPYLKIPKVLGGIGIAILSTPKGILEGEEARKQHVGGELLCYIW